MPLPDAIANAPELWLGLDLFFIAFQDLSTCRSQGYGEGPIGWVSIAEYCAVHEIEGEQFEDMLFHIQHMDAAYLKYRASKIKKVAESGNKGRRKK